MQIPDRTRRGSGSANLTPMVDVVFLLIIFFLVSSHLARQESRIPLSLPTASLSNETTIVDNRLTINVLPSGAWRIGGTDPDEDQLRSVLQAHREAHGEDAPVRIRVDRSVPYGRVEPILRAAASAGLWNAAFAVYQEP